MLITTGSLFHYAYLEVVESASEFEHVQKGDQIYLGFISKKNVSAWFQHSGIRTDLMVGRMPCIRSCFRSVTDFHH